jgi:nicotinamide-nucleotide amidase
MLRLTAKAASKDETDKLMKPVLSRVRETLGDIIYGVDTDSLESTVAGLLADRGLTLAVAESCTGGLLSKRLTDIPGASKFFMGGVVTYSTQTKTLLLGIDPMLINQNGVVSREVALAMADGARLRLGTDIGIGITGIAGPDSDDSGLEPGSVFVALTTKDAAYCRNLKLSYDRERVRIMSASHALDMVRRLLTGLEV